ncbi:MAG: methyltransferase domain-containing protein [Anaerolineae bacterium]
MNFEMFSPDLVPLLRCPSDRAPLTLSDRALVCTRCGESYPIRDGYAELLPHENFEHTTQYNDDEGGHILDYREMGPPLLSAKIKNDLLVDFLRPTREDIVLDLGCGNAKFAYWNRERCKTLLALDLAPWFADAALAAVPLLRGDIRVLPFGDATFDKVYSIDVFEHLTASDIARVLDEAQRVLLPGGKLFIFSNTKERQTLSWAMAPQRAVTNWLKRRGAVDFRRDEWRKSDHVKAIATYEELQATLAAHGFTVKRVAFWNGIFQGWVENVIVKLGEGMLSKRARGQDVLEQQVVARQQVRAALRSDRRARFYAPLAALTALMSLDLKLFGHLRAGPYFLLAEKAM